RLEGALDRAVLIRALGRIVERHESLRTVFRLVADTPMQLVQPDAAPPIAEHDVSGDADPEGRARALCDAHASAPFDLERDLPWRVLLVRTADGAHVLQIAMHHISSDGWSVGVVVDELGRLYRAYLA